jgi:hypothetical protein
MKRFMSLSLLLSMFAMGETASTEAYNWTVTNPNTYHALCSASGSECDLSGVAATWTLPDGIRVTRVEYQSSFGILAQNTLGVFIGPCPIAPSILVTDGTRTITLQVVNGGGLYSDSGKMSQSFSKGTKLSVVANFEVSIFDRDTMTSLSCTTPPGNVVVTYALD